MTTLHYVVLESNNSSQLLRIWTAKLQGCVFVGDGVDAGRVDGVDSRFSRFSRTRIIYTRFHTKSTVLLRRIKNQNIEVENQKLMVETLGPLQGRQEVFKDGATK